MYVLINKYVLNTYYAKTSSGQQKKTKISTPREVNLVGKIEKKMHISEYVRKLLIIGTQIKQDLLFLNKLMEYLMSKMQQFYLKCKLLEIAVLLGSLLLMPEF